MAPPQLRGCEDGLSIADVIQLHFCLASGLLPAALHVKRP